MCSQQEKLNHEMSTTVWIICSIHMCNSKSSLVFLVLYAEENLQKKTDHETNNYYHFEFKFDKIGENSKSIHFDWSALLQMQPRQNCFTKDMKSKLTSTTLLKDCVHL